jgi:pyruvate formate lyase activating enzyme
LRLEHRVHIKALLPASVIEYPGHIADVLYVGACNFRCPFCYNVDLVLRHQQMSDLEEAPLIQHLRVRAGFVDALVISGGEPTLQPDLISFLRQVRQTGIKIKLDTNGYRPDVLGQCLERGLLDYVAMDIKSSLSKYEQAAGVPVEVARVQQSIALVLLASIDSEFRTTVVPGLVELEDVRAIAQLIAGAKRYYLQCFRRGPTVGGIEDQSPALRTPPAEVLQQMAALAGAWVQEVGIRGLPQGLEDSSPASELSSAGLP